MKKLSFLSFCFSLALLFASCTKEGPMGPQGAQGPQGPAGSNGTNGTNGTNGQQGPAGSANVIYSNWSDSAMTWSVESVNNVPLRTASLPATAVNQEIMDRGVVLVYARTADSSVHTLPTMLHGTDGTNIFRFALRPGSIALSHSRLVNTGFESPAAQDVRFRYVIVPGGTASSRMASGYTSAQLQAMSYDQVVALFRIPK